MIFSWLVETIPSPTVINSSYSFSPGRNPVEGDRYFAFGFESVQPDHVPDQVQNADGLAHFQEKNFSAVAQGPWL